MKVNHKQLYAAIINGFLEVYKVKDLGKSVAERLDEKVGGIELQEAKASSFSMRCKKDADVTDTAIAGAIVHCVKALIDDRSEEIMDYIQDQYEIAYESDMVTEDFVKTLFDITRHGRIVYVDIDV